MAYQFNIPLATDQLSKSQGDIQGNFGVLGAIGGNNNIASAALNGTAGFNFVMFPIPDAVLPTFPAGNEALYNNNYATTTKNELFVHKITAGGTAEIPLTASVLSNVATFLPQIFGSLGWTYLPSGILIKWGAVTVSSGSPQIVNVNGGGQLGPNFSNVGGDAAAFQFFVSVNTNTGTTTATYQFDATTANLTLYCSSVSGKPVSWVAIGY